MSIVVVGLNHKTAPIEIREKLSFSTANIHAGLVALKEKYGLFESVIISTCNRVEVYGLVKTDHEGIAGIKRFLSEFHKIRGDKINTYLYALVDDEAVRHLLHVAASLDSMVIGESQIFGQVKRAYYTALEAKSTGTVFNGLFSRVINVVKKVRTDTEIGRMPVSVSSVAVDLARKIFGDLKDHTIMIIGAGKMSELTAKYLVDSGVKSVFVSNRSFDKACALAKKFKGRAIKFDEYAACMTEADIIIGSTGAPHYIINRPEVVQLLKERKNKPMFFIDISVPRNIDPSINTLDNVYLYNVDDLKCVADENKKVRENSIHAAEKIIEHGIGEIMAWYDSLSVVPTIVSLQKKVELLRQEELTKTMAKLKDMSEADKDTIDQMTRIIVKKLLSMPIEQLKEKNKNGGVYQHVESLRYLFKLTEHK